MSKDKITDYDATAANNTDVGGVNIAEGCNFGNMNNMGREIMSHLAELSNGTYPIKDTFSIADPADLTKIARFDCGSITTATTRVITIPDENLTLIGAATTATLTNKTIDGDDNTVQDLPYSAIKSTSRSGSDATLITGTAGTTNYTAKWNVDGDLVDGYAVLDEDDMSSDSATSLATQQSIKAYVDANGGVGVGQSWDEYTGSRSASTSYQNTTGKPIMVALRYNQAGNSGSTLQVSSDNSTWKTVGSLEDFGTASAIVPDNHYYRLASGSFTTWSELR